ncbi:MAG: ABC transporter permease, partial [Deltaproteobacteria bacterium]|nr:ABC transporter permease [Deltaproteobacteria bacterium]
MLLDPALVRLPEKLRPPLSRPNLQVLRPEQIPRLGIYLLGTDDLGRDVFARMLQGAWVSLTVGFVAVGISVVVGIFMGGIAGYFGQEQIRADRILVLILLFLGIGLAFLAHPSLGILLFALGICLWILCGRAKLRLEGSPWARFLFAETISVDTLIMRLVDIMLCFPSFFL